MRILTETGRLASRGPAAILILGVVNAFAVYVLHAFFGSVHSWQPLGYVVIGVSISCIEVGADRLWSNQVAATFNMTSPVSAFFTRVPFWYLAGGMGYASGMLFSKRFELMKFYDIPVKPIFVFGGWVGIALCAALYTAASLVQARQTPHRPPGRGLP